MEINNAIRQQVIDDLNQGMTDSEGQPMVALFVNGLPGELAVADPEYPENGSDIPAVSVSLGEGQRIDDDFGDITWSSVMSVRIYLDASNTTDPLLDVLGQKVLEVITDDYHGCGLLSLCNRIGFEYIRDDQLPWGILDVQFSIQYSEV